MINLDIIDLFKKKVYVVRYSNNQVFKTNNLNTLKRLKRALKVMNINDYHIYKIYISKEVDI